MRALVSPPARMRVRPRQPSQFSCAVVRVNRGEVGPMWIAFAMQGARESRRALSRSRASAMWIVGAPARVVEVEGI